MLPETPPTTRPTPPTANVTTGATIQARETRGPAVSGLCPAPRGALGVVSIDASRPSVASTTTTPPRDGSVTVRVKDRNPAAVTTIACGPGSSRMAAPDPSATGLPSTVALGAGTSPRTTTSSD